MKKLLLIGVLLTALTSYGQTIYKHKKDFVIEKVIQNDRDLYKIVFKSHYLGLGNRAEAIWFFNEIDNAVKQKKDVGTYVGNTYINITLEHDRIKVSCHWGEFYITTRELNKILKIIKDE